MSLLGILRDYTILLSHLCHAGQSCKYMWKLERTTFKRSDNSSESSHKMHRKLFLCTAVPFIGIFHRSLNIYWYIFIICYSFLLIYIFSCGCWCYLFLKYITCTLLFVFIIIDIIFGINAVIIIVVVVVVNFLLWFVMLSYYCVCNSVFFMVKWKMNDTLKCNLVAQVFVCQGGLG